MAKKLSEMTREELWQLFPIFLTEHNDKWKTWYNEEQKRLCGILSGMKARISHIGSTAIENIWAKGLITQNGYICMAENAQRISFNKGYTENGFAEKVFHLHLRHWGDNDELYFRDYLNDHPMVARDYEKLKLSLWKCYEHNRDGYTNAKHDFVSEYTQKAKQIYKDRY